MDRAHVLFTVLGLLLLGGSLWSRAGRSDGARWWVGSANTERAVLVLFPALGVVAVLAGLTPLTEDSHALTVATGLLVMLLLAIAVGWGVFSLPLPRWAKPAWFAKRTAYRAEARRKRARQTGGHDED